MRNSIILCFVCLAFPAAAFCQDVLSGDINQIMNAREQIQYDSQQTYVNEDEFNARMQNDYDNYNNAVDQYNNDLRQLQEDQENSGN